MNKNYCWRHRLRKIKPVYCANTKNGQSNNPDFFYDCLRRSRDNKESGSGSGSNEKRKESVFKRLRVSDDRISVVAAAVVVVVVVSAVVDDVVSAVVVIIVSVVVVVVVVAFSAVVVAIFVVVIVVLRFGKSENNIFDHAQRK